MMEIAIPIGGIIFAFILIKYREQIGDVFGDPEWMHALGGIHYVIVFIAIFIIFWSIAYATDTTEILFRPVLLLFPTLGQRAQDNVPDLNY